MEGKNIICLGSLDMTIERKITEIVMVDMLNKYGRYDISFEDFVVLLDEGMRDELKNEIERYYSFSGNVEIAINDAEYFKGFAEKIKQLV